MKPLHAFLPQALSSLVARSPLSPEKVRFAWKAAVGPAIARVTTVELTDRGVLRVTATSRAWATEIRRSSALILGRLAPLLGPGTARTIRVVTPANERRRKPAV